MIANELSVADDAEREGRIEDAMAIRARCLGLVDRVADEFRLRLGLELWSDFRLRVGYGPRSGRTTQGLLHALASCTIENPDWLLIVGSNVSVQDHCYHLACQLRYRFIVRTPVRSLPMDRLYLTLGMLAHVYVDHAQLLTKDQYRELEFVHPSSR